MIPESYDAAEFQRQYDDAMTRRDNLVSDRVTLGTLIMRAKANGYILPKDRPTSGTTAKLYGRTPTYFPKGMDPRDFAGPEIAPMARLFPMDAITLFVALGGVGKTTALMKYGCHIAAGRDYGGSTITQRRVLYYCVEEADAEIDRKFGAAVHRWPASERIAASKNFRVQSCVGIDARLTRTKDRQIDGTGIAEVIIDAVRDFEAEVVMIDHLQGFVSGDLNASDTATALGIELNKIVAATGAAVVVAAHVNKGQINAQGVEQGFATGSLAFENAARQLVGLIRLPDEDAQKFGLQSVQSDYGLIGIAKNSYGRSNVHSYFCKVYEPDFHTVTVEPFTPMMATTTVIPKANDRLCDALVNFIQQKGATTRAEIERNAGTNGPFKAGKSKVRDALKKLMGDGTVTDRPYTKADQTKYGVPRQTHNVLEVTT